jgi:hypothetical protein
VPLTLMTTSRSSTHKTASLLKKEPHNTLSSSLPPVLFVASPSALEFSGHELGEETVLTLCLRNVSAVLRRLRITPPCTLAFTMLPIAYPPHSRGGLIAPGMSVSVKVSFIRDTLADYEDVIVVETEEGGASVVIPLRATRHTPALSLARHINIGACLLGDAMRVALPCLNSGGHGRFQLFAVDDAPQGVFNNSSYDAKCSSCLRMSPFTLSPSAFALKNQESCTIFIEFIALSSGTHSVSFIILGDNLQSTLYTISGNINCK